MVDREASGNALNTVAVRGKITRTFPLAVTVEDDQSAEVVVTGGLGHIPMTFSGLTAPRGYELRVNDTVEQFWQTDWDAGTQRWKMTYNPTSSSKEPLRIQFGRQPG